MHQVEAEMLQRKWKKWDLTKKMKAHVSGLKRVRASLFIKKDLSCCSLMYRENSST